MWCAHHKTCFFNLQGADQASHASCQTFIDTNPRAKKSSRCQDIHRSRYAPPAAEETQIQNPLLRLATARAAEQFRPWPWIQGV